MSTMEAGGRDKLWFSAASSGDCATIKRLLKSNTDVNLTNSSSMTALMLACDRNQLETVMILLAHHADIDPNNTSQQSALMICMRQNHITCFNTLCEHLYQQRQREYEERDNEQLPLFSHTTGEALLRQALLLSRSLFIPTLVAYHVDLNTNAGAVHDLIKYSYPNVHMIECLLDHKAEIDIVSEHSSPLFKVMCRSEIVQCLLDQGAKVAYRLDPSSTSAVTLMSVEEVCCLAQLGHMTTHGTTSSDAVVIKQSNNMANCALHYAASCGYLETVEVILTHLVNHVANTPSLSSLSPAVSTITTHEDNHTSQNIITTTTTTTPNNNINNNITRMFVNLQLGDGLTPLCLAILNEAIDVVKYLIDEGADVNHSCNDDCVLSYAVMTRNITLVELLIEHGSDVNYSGLLQTNANVLQMCIDYSDDDIAMHLLSLPTIDLSHLDARSMSCLHYAAIQDGFERVIEAILSKFERCEP